MLKHLTLKDFVIVTHLDVSFGAGFTVLTGETGAGKSILIDALQLALGARADSPVVREGASRANITATFDAPAALGPWLEEHGFEGGDELMLRRVMDAQGKSRGFINGSPATLAQLREMADHLVDIHGQHAWQGLTRPASVRALLDEQAGLNTRPLAQAYAHWREAMEGLARAKTKQGELDSERERLAWQIGELERLGPKADEWAELNAEHQRLGHGQALVDAAHQAHQWVDEDDNSASRLVARSLNALDQVSAWDPQVQNVMEALRGAQAQLDDAAHSLNAYLGRVEPDPQRLEELDTRLSAWMGLARRYRRAPDEMPALLAEWRTALSALEQASDLAALERTANQAETLWREEAQRVSQARHQAIGPLSARVTEAMQHLGMAGGRFEVALQPQDQPQAFGLEAAEFLVAGHAGSTPRPLGKVASGGELSRLALAIAVTTARERQAQASNSPQVDRPAPSTLIFDEIDSGVGGTVADAVGRMMKQLGQSAQVLAVTHLPQVAACGDHHLVVAKANDGGQTHSRISPVSGEARVAEVARMLGGERAQGTSLAHAQELLNQATPPHQARRAPHA